MERGTGRAHWALALTLLCNFAITYASLIIPYGVDYTPPYAANGTDLVPLSNEMVPLSKRAGDFYLRIMPVGASVVFGVGSTDDNGFRKLLRDRLRVDGWNVNMVGSKQGGSMNDAQCAAVSGYIIDQAQEVMVESAPSQPNVMLINAGLNDCDQNIDIPNAHNRMSALLDRAYAEIEGLTIVLSTLTPSTNERITANSRIYNGNLRRMAQERIDRGDKLVFAEMADGFITLNDLSDDRHPNDEGFRKMAAVWYNAINRAEQAGFLTPPRDMGEPEHGPEDFTCPKYAGTGRGPIQTQQGSGTDDGPYVHKSSYQDVVLRFSRPVPANGAAVDPFWFANIFGTGFDDMLEHYTDGGNARYRVFRAIGGGQRVEMPVSLDVKDNCIPRGVRWGDIDGDGFDDFLCIDPAGNLYASLNEGWSGSENEVPTFRFIGRVFDAIPNYEQRHIRLGDIDGDGKIDYCATFETDGNIICWRNGGVGVPTFWQEFGTVFTGKGKGDIRGTRLIDLNGDTRADWLWVSDEGSVDTWINQRGYDAGLVPDWQAAGLTHQGMHEAGARDNVYFARSYLQFGKKSYLYITHTTDGDTNNFEVRLWRNDGGGGAMLKGKSPKNVLTTGDGNHYCDMKGNGADDYVWISPDGEMTLYANIHSPPGWGQDGVIFHAHTDRRRIHLADLDGDGKCDVIIVDKAMGQTTMWRNEFANGQFSFRDIGPYTGDARCTQGWGPGLFDYGIRFADISGDGRSDYLCIEKDGRTTGFINLGAGNFRDVGQVKFSEGKDRANLRWADVNGDGRADLLWIDKYNGRTDVYYNEGEQPASGSSFKWARPSLAYDAQVGRGEVFHFPNLGVQGRADLHQIRPRDNWAQTWYNECPGGGGGGTGDDGPIVDPGLPSYEPGPIPEDPDPSPDPPGNPGGPGGPVVFIDPSIWNDPGQNVFCEPPCTLVLPPLPLPTPSVITWPPFTTSVLVTINGATTLSTKTTELILPPFTVTDIDYWPVTVTETGAVITPFQSIRPPVTAITLDSTEASITTTVSGSATTILFPSFPTTSHEITIAPLPTISFTFPGVIPTPSVTFSSGAPGPTCVSGCGDEPNCDLFGCGATDCGIFGCSGGCKIGFCGGGGGCPPSGCGGGGGGGGGGPPGPPGCSSCCPVTGCPIEIDLPGGGGGGGGPDPDPEPSGTCSSSAVPVCTVFVTTVSVTSEEFTVTTEESSTSCRTLTACNTQGSTTTTATATTLPAEPACAEAGCGAACELRKRSPQLPTKTLAARAPLPAPTDSANMDSFVADIFNADGTVVIDVFDKLTPGVSDGPQSWYQNLRRQRIIAALRYLQGCTSLIIVSSRAIYIGHFWQLPAFQVRSTEWGGGFLPSDDETFERELSGPLERDGRAIDGLPRFRNVFRNDFGTRAIMIVPTSREDGSESHTARNTEIIDLVHRTLGDDLEVEKVPYVPNGNSGSEFPIRRFGRPVFMYEPAQEIRIEPSGCYYIQEPRLVVYFESDTPRFDLSWDAWLDQIVAEEGTDAKFARRNETFARQRRQQCPLQPMTVTATQDSSEFTRTDTPQEDVPPTRAVSWPPPQETGAYTWDDGFGSIGYGYFVLYTYYTLFQGARSVAMTIRAQDGVSPGNQQGSVIARDLTQQGFESVSWLPYPPSFRSSIDLLNAQGARATVYYGDLEFETTEVDFCTRIEGYENGSFTSRCILSLRGGSL